MIDGGTLGEHKGINVPGAVLPISAVTAKDADDLAFGVSNGVDYVALSFVQTADDIVKFKIAVYPGRISLGNVDRNRFEIIYLDPHRLFVTEQDGRIDGLAATQQEH